ncbi:translation initiation factor eIF-2B subunit delta [Thermosyntropha lipolytica DSM 11003]|uniref:Translation initiation factor eIF-2B subunit delta n=1 Tax=Thermosyntropha lipolytica DSM 11003 TaxID=1123382 RepID=A0A1M5NLA1_9FIRM|nr:hypothetical protein [Thermosyntropha lipolytica]SHG90346.1 translation initiation factor eIF-2B subunit delta [Thermosyntropha lipolytica DSM 11003]
MKEVKEAIYNLKNDQTHGASYLALEAVRILKKAALLLPAADNISFLQSMNHLSEDIKTIRPSMVSIYNLVSSYTAELNREENTSLSLPDLRLKAAAIADSIINQVLTRQKQTIQKGSQLVKDKSTLITCSYSSTIIEIIKSAYRQGRRFAVLIARSHPPGSSYAYGERAARKIDLPLNIKIIPDDCINLYLPQADYVLLGADTVLRDGSVINGYPSLELAREAFNHRIPCYVICETHKIAGEHFIPHLEAGFDLIPASFITQIITG